jgi:hypothetical protein
MKILIYTPSVIVDRHFGTDLEIAKKHIDQGDDVHFLYCDTSMSFCEQNYQHQHYLCLFCTNRFHNYMNILNIPKENIHKISLEKYINYDDLPDFNSIEEMKDYYYDGQDIGWSVVSTLLTISRDSNPDLDNRKFLIEKMFRTGIALYNSTLKILENLKPDSMYIFNGRTISRRPVFRAARKMNIKTFVHEATGILEKYDIVENSHFHDLFYIKKYIEDFWLNNNNFQEKELIAKKWYQERFEGKEQSWISFAKDQKRGNIPNIDKNKLNIGIFISSDDEFEAIDTVWKDTLFSDQTYVVNQIFQNLKDSNIHFYLRIHPNLAKIDNEQTRSLNKLKYNNLTIINAESKIDTYALIHECNKIVVFGSTVGLESAYLGKVVILLGRIFYEDLDVAYKPSSFEKLFELLINKDLKPLPNAYEDSIKYAYFESRRGFDYKYYKPTGILKGTFLNKHMPLNLFKSNFTNDLMNFYNNDTRYKENDFKHYMSLNNDKKILISIIIFDFGDYDLLKETLDSIKLQTYNNFEILIISTNKKNIFDPDILKNLNCSIIDFKYKLSKNEVFENLNGEFIKFIFSGDVLTSYSLELLLGVSKLSKKDLIITNHLILVEKGNFNINKLDFENIDLFFNKVKLNFDLLLENISIISKELILKQQEQSLITSLFSVFYNIDNNYQIIDIPIYIDNRDITQDKLIVKNLIYAELYSFIKSNLFQLYKIDYHVIKSLLSNFDYSILNPVNKDRISLFNLFKKHFDIEGNEYSYYLNNKNKAISYFNNTFNLNPLDDANVLIIDNESKSENILEFISQKSKDDIFEIDFYLDKQNDNKYLCSYGIKKAEILRANDKNGFDKLAIFFDYPFEIPNWISCYLDKYDKILISSSKMFDNCLKSGINENKLFIFKNIENINSLKNEVSNTKFKYTYICDLNIFNCIQDVITSFNEVNKNKEFILEILIDINKSDLSILSDLLESNIFDNSNSDILVKYFYDNVSLDKEIKNSNCFIILNKLSLNFEYIDSIVNIKVPIISNVSYLYSELFDNMFFYIDSVFDSFGKSFDKNVCINNIDLNMLTQKMIDISKNYYIYINNITINSFDNIKKYNINIIDLITQNNKNFNLKNSIDLYNYYLNDLDYINAQVVIENIFNNTKDYMYLLELGLCQLHQDKYELALDSFTEYLENGKLSYDLCNNIALCLEKLGDFETADIYYKKSFEL